MSDLVSGNNVHPNNKIKFSPNPNKCFSDKKQKEAENLVQDNKSSSNAMDSNSEKEEKDSNNEDTDLDSGTLRKKRLDEMLRQEVRKNIANQMLLPPPEELFKKTVVENEQARTGAPIPFLKFGRLLGDEKIEKLNLDNKNE